MILLELFFFFHRNKTIKVRFIYWNKHLLEILSLITKHTCTYKYTLSSYLSLSIYRLYIMSHLFPSVLSLIFCNIEVNCKLGFLNLSREKHLQIPFVWENNSGHTHRACCKGPLSCSDGKTVLRSLRARGNYFYPTHLAAYRTSSRLPIVGPIG